MKIIKIKEDKEKKPVISEIIVEKAARISCNEAEIIVEKGDIIVPIVEKKSKE